MSKTKKTSMSNPWWKEFSTPETRDEVYSQDRGEREYYESKNSLSEPIFLPCTLDGCEALIEMTCGGLSIPVDEISRQMFAGFTHHIPDTVKHTTLGDIGTYFRAKLSKNATWALDEASKLRVKQAKEAAKLEADKTTLTLAKGADDTGQGEQPTQ